LANWENLKLAKSKPVEVEWPGINPKPAWNWWNPEGKNLITQWRTVPYVYDWNKDGLMDIIMLDHEGYLAFWERYKENGILKTQILVNAFLLPKQTALSPNFLLTMTKGLLRLNTKEAGGSGRRKFCITDWDRDGLPDLIVNSVNATFLRNKGIRKTG
jgi:hypothetical protein